MIVLMPSNESIHMYRVSNKKIPHLKLSNNFANFTHIKMKISAFIDNIFLHIRGKFHCKR